MRDGDGRRAASSRARRPRSAARRAASSDADRTGTAREIAAWAADRLDPDGLDVGALVHAPDVRARLDARGLARHTFLCGQSGSGKTYTTGVLLEQISAAPISG